MSDLLKIDEEFFFIDSNNLNGVESRLYGYCITEQGIFNNASEDHPDVSYFENGGAGAYVYVRNDGEHISLYQNYP